jgi:hypothetical protein
VSREIDPPAGNLLVQASGRVASTTAAFTEADCYVFLGSETIGALSTVQLPGAITVASLAVTGAKTIAAGANTVSVRCGTLGEPHFGLTMFALVTG